MESVDGITCSQFRMGTIVFSRVDKGLQELLPLLYPLLLGVEDAAEWIPYDHFHSREGKSNCFVFLSI